MVYCSTNTPIVIAAICKTNFLRISYDGMMKYVRTVAAFAYDPHQTATTLTFLPGQGLQPRSTITSPQMEKHSSDGRHASRVCLFLHRPASPIILRSKAFGLFGCQTGSDWPSSSLSLCDIYQRPLTTAALSSPDSPRPQAASLLEQSERERRAVVTCLAQAIRDDQMTKPELTADYAAVVRAIHLPGDGDTLCDTRSTQRMPTGSEYEALSRLEARAARSWWNHWK